MKSCFIVPLFQNELSWDDNVKNATLAITNLKDLNVPVIVGRVGAGTPKDREIVAIIPLDQEHMKDSLVKVYHQSSYLKCGEDSMCSVVSVSDTGELSETQLGQLNEEPFVSKNIYSILARNKHYTIEGIV